MVTAVSHLPHWTPQAKAWTFESKNSVTPELARVREHRKGCARASMH